MRHAQHGRLLWRARPPARRRASWALDAVEEHQVGRRLDAVEDLVEGRGEVVDVLAVERRDEGLVQALDDVVDDLVADVLELEHLAGRALGVAEVVHERGQQLRGLVEVGRELREQAEVLPLLRDEAELHAVPSWPVARGGIRPPAGAAAYVSGVLAAVQALMRRRAWRRSRAGQQSTATLRPPTGRATGQSQSSRATLRSCTGRQRGQVAEPRRLR